MKEISDKTFPEYLKFNDKDRIESFISRNQHKQRFSKLCSSIAATHFTLDSSIKSSSCFYRSEAYTKLQEIQNENIKSWVYTYLEEIVFQQTFQIEAFGQVAADLVNFWKKETEKLMKLTESTLSLSQSKNVLEIENSISKKQLQKLQRNIFILGKKFNDEQLHQSITTKVFRRKLIQVSSQLEKSFLQFLELERKIVNISTEREIWKHCVKNPDFDRYFTKDKVSSMSFSTSNPSLAMLTGFNAKSLGYGSIEYTHKHTGFSFMLRTKINLDKESILLADVY